MAPSASLQARIAAFENLSISPKGIPDNILDSDPTSPTSDPLLSSFPALTPSFNHPPRSSSPPVLGRKTSLIDFSELSASPRLKNDCPLSAEADDILAKPPVLPPRSSPRIPPLPPRKPSQNSLKNWLPSKGPIPIPLPVPVRSSPISIASSKLFHPDSLSDPASNSSDGSSRHLPASSISSFQSVSLSSEGLGNTDNSLDDSYEAVSSTAATSPIVVSKDSYTTKPSTLNESSSTSSSTLTRRRPPPPPPTKPPPPPSLPSSSTTHSPTHVSALLRPVPIPISARKRYDALFERYTSPLSSQKGRSTSGWRGPSLDLLTGMDVDDSNENARIDGSFVKSIWVCSRLPRSRLKEIWDECDFDSTGSLDKYAFALGMWRIDEALRAAHQSRDLAIKSINTPPLPRRSANITYVPRPPPIRRTSQK